MERVNNTEAVSPDFGCNDRDRCIVLDFKEAATSYATRTLYLGKFEEESRKYEKVVLADNISLSSQFDLNIPVFFFFREIIRCVEIIFG